MSEGIAGYLRYRVVNRSPLFWFKDGFELLGGGDSNLGDSTVGGVQTVAPMLFHSLGNEAGTDNSILYWNQVAGVWTYAAHILTAPATAGAFITAGNSHWGDGTFRVRIAWGTGGDWHVHIHSDGTVNNTLYAAANGTVFRLYKVVAGTITQVATVNQALVNNTFYWVEVQARGTTYTCTIYSDTAGSIGAQLNSVSGTISDSALQSGIIGISNTNGTVFQIGGNFARTCFFSGVGPDGTQGQAWRPVVISGEPAFAQSKISPFAGTYHASIYLANAAASGSWQQTIRLLAGGRVNFSVQAKASAGTANVTAGGLTTGNAGTTYGLLSAVGAITANPTVSCNYSGAIGTAFFDEVSIVNPAFEITNNLPHLHQSDWKVIAMQPHNPSNSSGGTFKIPLFPPKSSQFYDAQPIYSQLKEYLRVEAYIGLGAVGIGLGKLVFAGFITGMVKSKNESGGTFELIGFTDIGLANLSRPFPGESLELANGTGLFVSASYRQMRNYFAVNEPGWMDKFSPYTPGNYTAIASYITFGVTWPGSTWSAGTDDGRSVVTTNNGVAYPGTPNDSIIVSKVGARAGDALGRQFVQVSGRLLPSTTGVAGCGRVGVGLAGGFDSNGKPFDYVLISITAVYNAVSGRNQWDLTVILQAAGGQTSFASALTACADAEGYIPFTINVNFGFDAGSASRPLTMGSVNGRVFKATFLPSAPLVTYYPFLYYGGTDGGLASVYFYNLIQKIRVADDLNPGTATFMSGSIGSPAHSLFYRADAGNSFLDMWTRAAILEGWYWRYTPLPYNVGSRLLGVVDFIDDPGSDLSSQCKFSFENQNLKEISLTANDDSLASGTVVSSPNGTDGGGNTSSIDLDAVLQYGIIEDQTLFLVAPTFSEQQKISNQILTNKLLVGQNGAKIASLVRDVTTVNQWRELDLIELDDKDLGILNLASRILSYTFKEGDTDQIVELDQFSIKNTTVPQKRGQQALFQIAKAFANR